MVNTNDENTFMRKSAAFLGAFLLLAGVGVQSARAGPDESYQDVNQCAWVNTADPRASMSFVRTPHPEPSEDHLISEDVNVVTGLYTRSYSRELNGIIDYKTARQIVISEYNEYWNTVVHTKEFPLLYWEDADHDGEFDMWVDQHGDGSPCDIVPYQIHTDAHNSRTTGF